MSDNLPTIPESKLLKVTTGLTPEQIQKFFSATPKSKIRKRPAKGGGEWSFVSGSYTIQVLNSLFGFEWNFSIVTSMAEALATAQTGSIVVQGRLDVPVGDKRVIREQYGRKEVAFKKETRDPLDFGNDMKAASTDALKKCASSLGLFADVYSQEDFFEATIISDDGTDISSIETQIKKAATLDELMDILSQQDPETQKNIQPAIDARAKEIRNA